MTTMKEEEKRIKRRAGIVPGRGEKYTSPGGFIKIPTSKGDTPKPGQADYKPPKTKKKG